MILFGEVMFFIGWIVGMYWVDRFGLATPVFGLVYFGSVRIDLFIFFHFQMFSMLIRKLNVKFKILNKNSWTKISKDIFFWKAFTCLGHPEPNQAEKWPFLDCWNRTDTEITILSHLCKNRIMSFLSLILLSQTKTPANCKNVCWVKNSAALAKALGTVKLWHRPKIEIFTLTSLNW